MPEPPFMFPGKAANDWVLLLELTDKRQTLTISCYLSSQHGFTRARQADRGGKNLLRVAFRLPICIHDEATQVFSSSILPTG